MDSVITRLKQAREQSGLTLAELAKVTGYALTTLSSVENGHDHPSKRLFKQWVQALKVNEAWLKNGTGEPFMGSEMSQSDAKQNLSAPIRFRIRNARKHASALLQELDQLEQEIHKSQTRSKA